MECLFYIEYMSNAVTEAAGLSCRYGTRDGKMGGQSWMWERPGSQVARGKQ